MFSGGIQKGQWHEMGKLLKAVNNFSRKISIIDA